MATYEEEQSRLMRLMEEVSTEDEIEYDDDDSDISDTDHIEERENNSDTEQDISDDEIDQLPDDQNSGPFFIGKDKESKWMKHLPTKTIRTRSENKVIRLPTSRLPTRSLKTPIDIFRYFINDKMIDIIVKSTNLYISSISDNFQRERDAKTTHPTEVLAFLGLLLYSGVLKANRLNIEELWRSDGSGIEMFRLVMSIKRFRFLLRCLRFDNKDTRQNRQETDKLAPIREFFDIFVENCKTGYSLSEYVTVDEKLEAFRGRCSFRQYIPSKPNKYGIKIFALCDAKMYYTANLEVYVGQQPEGPYKVSNSPNDIVERLCNVIKGSARNVTLDNWFTSIPLVETLLKDFKLTVVGTIRKNKKELPLEFSCPTHPPGASVFGYTKQCTLVSYVPKKKKNVVLVSSLHHDDNIDDASGKPEIITDYNNTKGGVDVVDRLCANYNVARNTKRWPIVIFYSLVNVAGINSQVVYSSNNPSATVSRRSFLRNLAFELTQPHLKERATIEKLPISLKSRLREICNITEAPASSNPIVNNQTGRCAICSTKKNRKTRYYCRKCSKFMCLEHIVVVCDECFHLDEYQNE